MGATGGDPRGSEGSAGRNGEADFDFHLGTWRTHVARLLHPLSGRDEWAEYEGTSVVRRVWGTGASVFELDVHGPAGRIEGVGLRLYNPHSHQWSLNWASRRVGTVDPPMVGEFRDGIGAFYGSEAVDGRVVLARNRFLEIAPDSSCFEPAYSADGGETWETNWVMRFTRTDVPRVAPERAERNRDGERGDGSAR